MKTTILTLLALALAAQGCAFRQSFDVPPRSPVMGVEVDYRESGQVIVTTRPKDANPKLIYTVGEDEDGPFARYDYDPNRIEVQK